MRAGGVWETEGSGWEGRRRRQGAQPRRKASRHSSAGARAEDSRRLQKKTLGRRVMGASARREGRGRRVGTGRRSEDQVTEIFRSVDQEGLGELDEAGAADALAEGPWGRLGPETVALLVAMVAGEGGETEGLRPEGLGKLWRRLEEWCGAWECETGGAGRVGLSEGAGLLGALGYRLSDGCGRTLLGRLSGARWLEREDFFQTAALLHALTRKFKRRDKGRLGSARLSFEDFVDDTSDLVLRLQFTRPQPYDPDL